MAEGASIAAIVAVLALALNVFMSVRGGAWSMADRFAGMEQIITAALAAHKESSDTAISSLRKDLEERIDRIGTQTGEAVRSARELYHQQEAKGAERHLEMSERVSSIEKWARDEFVRKQSFERVVTEMRQAVDASARRVEDGLAQLRQAFMERAGGGE